MLADQVNGLSSVQKGLGADLCATQDVKRTADSKSVAWRNTGSSGACGVQFTFFGLLPWALSRGRRAGASTIST